MVPRIARRAKSAAANTARSSSRGRVPVVLHIDKNRLLCNVVTVKLVAVVAALLLARPALAEPAPAHAAGADPAFTIGSRPAWLLLGGLTTGGTIALADRGALVGGELSLARLREASFVGFYADAYHDWGAGGAYVTGGLEAGHKLVGIDAGAALRFADGDRALGAAGRVTLGLGVAGIYARYLYFPDAREDDHVLQLGLVLKLPLWTNGQ